MEKGLKEAILTIIDIDQTFGEFQRRGKTPSRKNEIAVCEQALRIAEDDERQWLEKFFNEPEIVGNLFF